MIDELDLSKFEGHTPGPWRISRHARTLVETYGGRGICSTGSYSDNNDAENVYYQNQANADLIAAAPDLLVEVKRLREYVARLKDPTPEMIAAGDAATEQIGPIAIRSAESIFRAMLTTAAASPLTTEEIDAATAIWSPKHASKAEK